MHQLGRHGLSRAAVGVVAAECANDVVAVTQGSFTHFVGRSRGAGRHNVLRFGQGARELGMRRPRRPPRCATAGAAGGAAAAAAGAGATCWTVGSSAAFFFLYAASNV